MILPDKYLPIRHCLLGAGATLLGVISQGDLTVTGLWRRSRELPELESYDRFTLCLDLLYSMDLVRYEAGLVRLSK